MSNFAIAIVVLFFMAGPAVAGVSPEGTSGLTCTSPMGARVRINLNPRLMRYQKEGFGVLPILESDRRTFVFTRFANDEIRIVASLNRQSLVYTAQSQNLASSEVSRADYKCVASGPIDFMHR